MRMTKNESPTLSKAGPSVKLALQTRDGAFPADKLSKATLMARQRLGQHFLSDPGWREKIVRAIRVSPHGIEAVPSSAPKDYCWIEIGAGHGEMTQYLVRSGVPVYAVELDAPLVERLKRLAQEHPNLTIVPGDVLQADLRAIAAGRRVRLYGNLPYYITSPILHHLFAYADLIDEVHLVIQLEVAQRLTARPGSKLYGYLSVVTQFYARPDFVLRLPCGAFRPPPEVGSALVTMRFPGERAKLAVQDNEGFLEFVKTCFAQKRKTLSNNLRAIVAPEQTRSLLRELNLRQDARAEQLSVADLAAVYRSISSAMPRAGRDNRT
jgi:16S rRNA (adenine1518-N6/adenine1519-N6)-dimethyltransferase